MTDSAIQTLITAVEQADSPDRLVHAVQALAAARSPAGATTLIAVLGYNNPGAAAIAVQGLVQIGATAVEPLIELLDDYNYGARAYAIRALAAIADPRALEVLLSAAETDFAPSVRRAATKGIGTLRWLQLPADRLAAAQAQSLQTLLRVSQDADWSLRYAAVVGLQALAAALPAAAIGNRFTEMLASDPDLAVRARVSFAVSVSSSSAAGDYPIGGTALHQQSLPLSIPLS